MHQFALVVQYNQVTVNGEWIYCWIGVRRVDWRKVEEEAIPSLDEISEYTEEQRFGSNGYDDVSQLFYLTSVLHYQIK
ncbi:MAG: hypothetical protein WBP64_14970 [Nitrososphaeraceae archaeon]